jgi:hypothetical protein
VSLRRLVKEALRMRPDRLIVGEVRDAEALDLLLALHTGVPGAATIHANSADDALSRLATLLLAGRNIDAAFVQPAIATGVHLVVHCGAAPAVSDSSRRSSRRPVAFTTMPSTPASSFDGAAHDGRLGRGARCRHPPRLSPWLWPRTSAARHRSGTVVSRMLDEAGFAHASTMRPVLIAAVLSALFCAISWLATGLGAVALVAAAAGAAAPFTWLRGRARRLRRSRRALWSTCATS